jgi:sensor histidine kinase YesM
VLLRRLTSDRSRLFWTLHIGGWVGFALFNDLMGIAAHGKQADYLLPSLGYAASGVVITYGLRLLFKRAWRREAWISITTSVIGVVIAALIFAAARQFIYLHAYEGFAVGAIGLADYFNPWEATLSLYLIGTWSGLYFGIKYYRMVQQQREQVLRATGAAHEAKLKMLRYQLNPHFLFNTLNAISTLVLEGEGHTANRMVSRLSAFLRHSLDRDPMQKVTLKKEIEAVNLYLTIEKIRFEDRLRIELDIQPEAYRALVPSMILQPLIENAIKYAIHISEDGGLIVITARLRNDMLYLSVADNGPGIPELDASDAKGDRAGKGVGLANIRERLQVLYGNRQEFLVENLEPHGLKVTLGVPHEHL